RADKYSRSGLRQSRQVASSSSRRRFGYKNRSPSTDRSNSGEHDGSLWRSMFPAATLRLIAEPEESAIVKGRLERFAIACTVGADLCVCPGLVLSVTTGADTQVCPYTDSQTALEKVSAYVRSSSRYDIASQG